MSIRLHNAGAEGVIFSKNEPKPFHFEAEGTIASQARAVNGADAATSEGGKILKPARPEILSLDCGDSYLARGVLREGLRQVLLQRARVPITRKFSRRHEPREESLRCFFAPPIGFQ